MVMLQDAGRARKLKGITDHSTLDTLHACCAALPCYNSGA